MVLEWCSPIKIKGAKDLSKANKKGVYIWGFRIDKEFIPYYVGKAVSIQHRIKEHISFILSGKYSIYDQDHLKDFYNHPIKFEPYWPANFLDFLSLRQELAEDIDFMIDNFEFTFAEVKDSETSPKLLNEVEKYYIKLIGIPFLANTKGGNSSIDYIEHKGCEEILNIFDLKQ